MIVLEYILLVGVIVCAIAAPLCKRLLASVIVYMALSLMMAVLWSLLQSPDLAITEAAVGAGRGHEVVFGIILGTGVGGGVVVRIRGEGLQLLVMTEQELRLTGKIAGIELVE